jgi:hypothetical protein
VKLQKVTIAVLLVLMTLAIFPSQAAQGPREDDLQMFFYTDVLASYAALEAGEVDIVGFDIQEPIYIDAITNPNVALAPVDDMGMYEIDINNNWTIPSYPGMRAPTTYTEFRQAMSFMVDKDLVVDTFCGGFAARIDQPIAPPTPGWMNASNSGANFPYEYDPAAGSALLDSAGWTNGSTPNPYYDPAFPGSTTTIRTYPPGHSKAGLDLDDVIVYVRTDDPRRFQAGRHFYENARKVGIPMDVTEAPSSGCYPAVMDQHDYHFYTGGWGLGRFPTYVYPLYHTDFYVLSGPNYVNGFDDTGNPIHPILNQMLYDVYYADTFSQALSNCQGAMGRWVDLAVTIPLFGARAYWVYSTELLGTVNMDSYAYDQNLFFTNVYKASGEPIKWAVITPPNQLNIMYSSWTYDFQCLNRIYDYGGFDLPPYNIAADQPGWVLDWFADTWVDPDDSETKAKNFKSFRTDNYFVGTDGSQLEQILADDYLFSVYLQYALGVDAWSWSDVQDLKTLNKVNDTYVELFYDARSYWLYTACSPAILPRSIWLNESYGLCQNVVTTFVVDTNLTTPGGLGIGHNPPNGPVWVNSITGSVSGVLTEWVDYKWELGDFVIETALVSGETVTVDWWMADDSTGYTLGDNAWELVTVGGGLYYATGFSQGLGGFFTAKGNPFYYFETPVLGEVDFVWESGGYYEVTIFDVVKAAGAYGAQGTAVPDSNWFPGADLAPPGGVIDIFDIVTIAGKYGQTSGEHTP